jgi:hypothetical protein
MIDASAFEHNDNFTAELADNDQYALFVDKFKAKKTTDDCYTPKEVYETIKQWVCEEYGIDPETIVRPFYPGGDYEHYDYPAGCTVLDNPPFSILSKICGFYLDRGIKFFLFAPSLTCLSGRSNNMRMNHVIIDCDIVYDNGAVVRTSFVTNYGGDTIMQTAPELSRRVNATVDKIRKESTAQLPKYEYPDNIITAAMLQRWCKYGVEFSVKKKDCTPIYSLDAQREHKKSIYGGGLLLSERAAAERAAAERAAAERAAAGRAAAERAAAGRAAAERASAHVWKLSERELEIVKMLGVDA